MKQKASLMRLYIGDIGHRIYPVSVMPPFSGKPERDIDPVRFFRYNEETAPKGDITPRLFPEPGCFFHFVPTKFDREELPP